MYGDVVSTVSISKRNLFYNPKVFACRIVLVGKKVNRVEWTLSVFFSACEID